MRCFEALLWKLLLHLPLRSSLFLFLSLSLLPLPFNCFGFTLNPLLPSASVLTRQTPTLLCPSNLVLFTLHQDKLSEEVQKLQEESRLDRPATQEVLDPQQDAKEDKTKLLLERLKTLEVVISAPHPQLVLLPVQPASCLAPCCF